MTLASTGAIITDAVAEGAGVGAFNLIQLETLEAIVAGAEQAGLPVILQISENTVDYHGALAPIAAAALAAAAAARVPVAVHLDHVTSPQLVTQAIALGIPSVMFDASALHYAQNVAQTAHVTRECHAAGVWVEAELGKVGGKDGAHAPGVRTDPDEAISFVRATGVDALAVAVGSSHAMRTRDADLDLALIARLHSALDVPLVLHGSSGVSDANLAAAVRAGMTKVNIGTHLNGLITSTVRTRLASPDLIDPRKYLGPTRPVVSAEVARLLHLLRHGNNPARPTRTPAAAHAQ
jgi:fructose-bisphosphate aldolase class II